MDTEKLKAGKRTGLWCRATIFASLVCFSTGSVEAQTADVQFNGGPNINGESCTIEVLRDGTFGVNPNLRAMNSRFFGGTPGEVRVTSRKFGQGSGPGPRFRITLEPPATFSSAPAGGNTNLDWRSWFSGTSVSNGVNFGLRNGTRSRGLPRLGTSVTLVTAHLRSRKTIGIFPAGDYTAEAVFRCE